MSDKGWKTVIKKFIMTALVQKNTNIISGPRGTKIKQYINIYIYEMTPLINCSEVKITNKSIFLICARIIAALTNKTQSPGP